MKEIMGNEKRHMIGLGAGGVGLFSNFLPAFKSPHRHQKMTRQSGNFRRYLKQQKNKKASLLPAWLWLPSACASVSQRAMADNRQAFPQIVCSRPAEKSLKKKKSTGKVQLADDDNVHVNCSVRVHASPASGSKFGFMFTV